MLKRSAALAAMLSLALATPALAKPSAYQPQRFSVEVTGKGSDVILIPGLNSPREVWQAEAERLKARHRVHLVQLRGFGEAAGINAQGPVLEPFVADLARYIRDNRLRGPAVIGHSLGGLAAMMLGADHSGVAGRIMVVDAVPFIATLFDPAATLESIRPRAQMMKTAMLAQGQGWAAPTRAPDCSAQSGDAAPAPGVMATSNAALCRIGGWIAASDPRVGAQAMADDMLTDMREGVGRITVPLRVVYGVDEKVLPAQRHAAIYAQAYAKAPGAQLVPISSSRHFVMLDQPEALHREIELFLK